MHQLKVRKVRGSAAVAWEEWLDCEVQAADCTAAKAGKQTGVNWSAPSRVLMVMGPNGVVHGVGTYGSITLTSGEDGITAVMISNGQRDDWTATPEPTTSGQSAKALPSTQTCGAWSFCPYVASGPTLQPPLT